MLAILEKFGNILIMQGLLKKSEMQLMQGAKVKLYTAKCWQTKQNYLQTFKIVKWFSTFQTTKQSFAGS